MKFLAAIVSALFCICTAADENRPETLDAANSNSASSSPIYVNRYRHPRPPERRGRKLDESQNPSRAPHLKTSTVDGARSDVDSRGVSDVARVPADVSDEIPLQRKPGGSSDVGAERRETGMVLDDPRTTR